MKKTIIGICICLLLLLLELPVATANDRQVFRQESVLNDTHMQSVSEDNPSKGEMPPRIHNQRPLS